MPAVVGLVITLALAGAPSAAAPSSRVATETGTIAAGLGSGGRNFDVWLVSSGGTRLRRLTTDPAVDTSPVWSPDGARLAYLCRFEDNSANLNGLGGGLGDAIDFGPLGHHRNSGGRLCVVSADGSGQRTLVRAFAAAAPAWSPDGSRIAFVRPNKGIYVVGADGQGLRRLTAGEDDYPAWSPDGTLIAFNTEGGLFVMQANGTKKHRVSSGTDDLGPSWSPDGALIAFTRFTDRGREVRTVGPGGTGGRRLAYSTGSVLDPNISMDPVPAWEPDGKRLAFDVASPRGVSSIGVVNVDGNGLRIYRHNHDGDFHPGWSPDGTAIVVTSWPAKGEGVGILDVESAGPPRIILKGYNNRPTWQPTPKPPPTPSTPVQINNFWVCTGSDTHPTVVDAQTGQTARACNRDWGTAPFVAGNELVCSAEELRGSGQAIVMTLVRQGIVVLATPDGYRLDTPDWYSWLYYVSNPAIPAGSYVCQIKLDGSVVAEHPFSVAQ